MKNFTRNQLEIGNWIEYQGEIYNFIGIDKTKSTNYLLQNYETKINFPVSYNDLCTSEPEIIIAKSKADLDKKILAISEHAENQLNCFSETSPYYIKAKEIFDIVRIIDDNLYFIEQEKIKNQINSRNGEISFPKINKTEILIRLCEEYGISKSTYYNYKKKISRSNNDIHTLSSLLIRKSKGITKFEYSTINFVDTLIMREFGSKDRRLKKSFFYEEVLKSIHNKLDNYWIDFDKCDNGIPHDLIDSLLDPKNPNSKLIIQNNTDKLKKIKIPGKSWTYNYLDWFVNLPQNGKKIIKNRYGDDFWETNMGMFGNYTYKAEYPLQYVFTDHAFLDVFIVDEETRSKTFRIWLTIFIDVYSRSILGFDLNTESPSIESITSAFRNSILEKTSLLKKYNITQEWPCFGKPWSISLDNAWAHRSHTFEELARFLEISLEYRPPYKSRYGAIVERAIGNIQGKIKSMFPGGIVTPAKKGKINAFDEACLTMNDIYEMVLRLIVNYQNHPHSSLKQTPNDVWNRGIQTIPPHPVMMTPELERKLWYLLPGERIIGQKGISCFGMKYTSEKLRDKGTQIGLDGKKKKFRLSVDKEDISRLAVWDMSGTLHTHPINGKDTKKKGNLVCEVYANELIQSNDEKHKISLSAYELAKEIQKELVNKNSDWHELLIISQEKTKQRRKEKKNFNKKINSTKYEKTSSAISDIDEYKISRKENDKLTKFLSDFNE